MMFKKFLGLLLLFTMVTVGYTEVATHDDQVADPDCPRLELCFSPYQICSKVVMLQLAAADFSIDLALYSLTEDNIAQAIIDAHKRGVKVRLAIDKAQAGGKSADDEKLEEVGIPVKRMRGMAGGLMHHKFAIIDGKTVLTGSYNWTKGGTYKNSENLLIMDSLVEEYQIEFNKLWNKKVRKKKEKKKK